MSECKELTLGSLFDGIGGWLLAAAGCGIKPVWSSEIDEFPMAVSKYHFPDVEQLGDITKINGAEIEPVDIICAGSPCQNLSMAGNRKGLDGEESGLFIHSVRIVREMREATNGEYPKWFVWENVCFAKGTLILTDCGLKEIQDVVVGDKVLTKSGEYNAVVKTHTHKNKEVIVLGISGTEPLTVTPNHPFWVKPKGKAGTTDACWKNAGELQKGDWVAYRTDGYGTKTIGLPFAYAIGRWLADGCIATRDKKHTGSRGGQKHRIFISTGYKKYELLKQELLKLPYNIGEHKMAHAVNFTFSSDYFAELIESCSKGATNKKLPSWTFQLTYAEQKEMLRGYLDGDGYIRRENEVCFTTASKHLAYGIARLVRNIYHVGCGIGQRMPRENVVIEGRSVKSRGAYDCWFNIPCGKKPKNKGSYYDDGFVWCKVKGVKDGIIRDVYNLSVDKDNTYCANGVTVHNCGAFSSNKGNDFRVVLEEIAETTVPMPKSGKWAKAGMVRSNKCYLSWRVLDAQYWGTPQRRARVFIIASLGKDRRPEVLFEPESVPWNPPQSREQGKETPRDTRESSEKASRTVCIEGNGTRASHMGDGYKESDVMYTLNTVEKHAVCTENQNVKCIGNGQVHQLYLQDTVGALNCMSDQQKIIQGIATQSYSELKLSDKAATLRASGGVYGGGSENYVLHRI